MIQSNTKASILEQRLGLTDNIYVSRNRPQQLPLFIAPDPVIASSNWKANAYKRFAEMQGQSAQDLLTINNLSKDPTTFIEEANVQIASQVQSMVNARFSDNFAAVTGMASKSVAKKTITVQNFIDNYINVAIDAINQMKQDPTALILFKDSIKNFNAAEWANTIGTILPTNETQLNAAQTILKDLANVLNNGAKKYPNFSVNQLAQNVGAQAAGDLNEQMFKVTEWSDAVASSLVTGGLKGSNQRQIKTDVAIKGIKGSPVGNKFSLSWNANLNLKATAAAVSPKTGLPSTSLKLLTSSLRQALFANIDDKELLANQIVHDYGSNRANLRKALLVYNFDKALMGSGGAITANGMNLFDSSTLLAITTSSGVKIISTISIINEALRRINQLGSGGSFYGGGLTVDMPSSAPPNTVVDASGGNNYLDAVTRSNSVYQAVLGMSIAIKFNPNTFFKNLTN